MLFTTAAVSLIGAAAASPLSFDYPARELSTGFKIMVNVTDLSRDLPTSVHKKYLTALHTGPGTNQVGIAKSDGPVPVFYQNGTAEEQRNGYSVTLADLGTPGTAFGLGSVHPDPANTAAFDIVLNGGHPNEYFSVTAYPEPVSIVEIATAGICPATLPSGETYDVLRMFYVGNDNKRIPEECAPVKLIPECAELTPSEGASLKYSLYSSCYVDPASINWAQYKDYRPGQ